MGRVDRVWGPSGKGEFERARGGEPFFCGGGGGGGGGGGVKFFAPPPPPPPSVRIILGFFIYFILFFQKIRVNIYPCFIRFFKR